MDLLQPMLMSDIINNGVATGDFDYIVKTGLAMLLVALVGVLGGLGCMYFSTLSGMSFGTDVRNELFKKIQSFSFANLDSFKTSSLITRLTNDVTQAQNMVMMMMRMLIRAPLLALGGIVMAILINVQLAIILVIVLPILAAIIAIITKKGFPLFDLVQKKLDMVNNVLRENLSGIRVVKAFVREEAEKGKFNNASEDLRDTSVKAFKIIVLQMPVMMLLMNISTIAVLWYGAKMNAAGNILVGDIMAFIQYLMQILFSLMMVAMFLMMFSRSKVSVDRINEVLDTKVDISNPENPLHNVIKKGKIEFKNVTFRYEGSTGDPVLSNISFTANPGQTIGILGSTGSGKSTLVSLIPRLYDATEGKVLIDGVDVRDMDLAELRKNIGFVLQENILFSGSIRENLKWGDSSATEDELIEASDNAGAYEFILNTTDKFDTSLEQMATNLSGGQKQRLSIARALVKKPIILIMDDSTSAVDMTTASKIQKALQENFKACTKIMIAQRVSNVFSADKIIIIQGGEIVAEGSHELLIKESQVYIDIYNSQIQKEVFCDV